MFIRRLLCSCAIAAGLSGAALAEDLNVQVREAPVREKPNQISTIIGTLKYGDVVTVLEKMGEGWKRVEHKAPSKLAGWVRSSTLTPQGIDTSKSQGAKTTATTSEAAEAGGGVLEKGEKTYVDQNKLQAAMAQVDALERNPSVKVSPTDVQSFLQQGGVTPQGGN